MPRFRVRIVCKKIQYDKGMKKLSEYTESEFLYLVQKIFSADCETEEDGNRQVK